MVVDGNAQAPHHHAHGRPLALLDLILVHCWQLVTQEVENGKGETEEEVAGEGQQYREEGGRDQGVVLEDQVVPQRLQKQASGVVGGKEQ